MAKMTKTQSEYAVKRLTSARDRRVADVRAEHVQPGITLTLDQKWELIREGRVQPLAKYMDRTPWSSNGWADVFDFSPFETKEMISSTGAELLAQIKMGYSAAMDELILGDAEGALEAIRAFEEGGA